MRDRPPGPGLTWERDPWAGMTREERIVDAFADHAGGRGPNTLDHELAIRGVRPRPMPQTEDYRPRRRSRFVSGWRPPG